MLPVFGPLRAAPATATNFLGPLNNRLSLVSPCLQHSRRSRCCGLDGSKDQNDAAEEASDENKAFKIKPSNRRQPIKPTEGASSDLIAAMSELSKGRAQPSQGTKSVFGADQMSWREVDEAINEYPSQRVFTAVGLSTPGFQENMIECVEKALNFKVHPESVQVRASSGSKYVSIKIGPVMVSNADEVIAVYTAMKEDERLKWFI